MRTSDVWPQPLRASPSTISSLWARLHGAWRVSSLHAPSIPAGFPRPQRIVSLTRCFTTILETNFDTLPSLVHWRVFGLNFCQKIGFLVYHVNFLPLAPTKINSC